MTPEHEQSLQDLADQLEAARRHLAAYATAEGHEAYHELHSAVQALGRLVSGAEAVKAPLAEELMVRQTDLGDQLGGFFAEVVGDREYGIDPEGGVSHG